MLRSFFFSLASFVFIVAGHPAHASVAYSALEQDWSNADETDETLQTPVCRAFTDKTDSAEPIELSLSFPKDGKTLPMLRLKTKLSAPLIEVQITSKISEPLFLLKSAASTDDSNIYWYAPVNFPRFENLIRAANTLQMTFDPNGQPLPVKVSLRGSTNALNQVATCLKGLKEPAAFWTLLNGQKDNLTPDLGDRSPAFLLQSTQTAYNAYLAGLDTKAAIAALQKPVAALLQKEAYAQKVIAADQVAQDKAQKNLDDLNTQITSLTNQIAQDTADLANFKTQKPGADADLAAKKATFQTLQKQMVPYAKAVQDAKNLVGKYQKAIRNDQALIARYTQAIQDDHSEKSSLNASLPRLRGDIDSAQDDVARAQWDYRRFDREDRIRDILDEDFWYNDAKRSIDGDNRDVSDAQNKVSSAQSSLSGAQSALSSCQNQQGADCSSQQSAVSSAQSALSSARSDLSQAQSRLRDHRQKIQQAECDAREQAEREQDALNAAVNRAESELSDAQDALSRTLERISEIPDEIAGYQSKVASYQADIPKQQASLADAQTQQATAQTAYDQFAQQIGFDVATKNLADAQTLDDTINNGIKTLTKQIPSEQKQLKKSQGQVSADQKALANAQATLTAAQAKLVPIETALQPYHDQVAPLQANLAQETLDFQTQRVIYQDLFQILAGN